GRDLQSGRAEPRPRVVRPAAVYGRRRCQRHAADAGSRAAVDQTKRRSLLSGGLQRNVRAGGRDAAARDHAISPAKPLRLREGFWIPPDGELSRSVRLACQQWYFVQSRIATPRRDIRDAQNNPRGRPDPRRASAKTLFRQPECEA